MTDHEPAPDARAADDGREAPAGDAPPPHTQARRSPLDREEQAIKDDVLRMGALVEEAIRAAAAALTAHDAALALSVIKGDARINDDNAACPG